MAGPATEMPKPTPAYNPPNSPTTPPKLVKDSGPLPAKDALKQAAEEGTPLICIEPG